MQPGAVTVVGISGARLAERRDRLVTFAELCADFTEREPGRGEIRRELDGLLQKIGGGGQVALELEVAGKLETAVGHQIAGGLKQAQGHWELVIAGLNPAIHQKSDCLRGWM